MKNPYEDELPDETTVMGRGVLWVFTVVFLLLIVVPPLSRNLGDAFRTIGEDEKRWVPGVEFFRPNTVESQNLLKRKKGRDPLIARETPDLRDHFQAFEKKLESDAPFAKASRKVLQRAMVRTFREGNRKTVVADDGWLLYRPAIDALTGMGPLRPEPKSVADDPTLPPWEGPLEPILAFGQQLKGMGVELILVPLSVKPMIVGQEGRLIRHADAQHFYGLLRENGIEVLDIGDAWLEGAKADELFLKQDTHWTPTGMEKAADLVAEYVRLRPWFGDLGSDPERFRFEEVEVASQGDLVGNLDIGEEQGIFEAEGVTARRVIDGETSAVVALDDRESSVVLLGDSFTNIYRQEDMDWGTGAGFGEHLAARLGMSLDVIAQNGQASTGVRKSLANRRGSAHEMRDRKKIVVWTIAARDLFLGESVARETDVEWGEVAFNDLEPLLEGEVLVEATLEKKSAFPDPKTVTYKSAVYAVEYKVTKVEVGSGVKEGDIIVVYHWAFQNRKLSPAAAFSPGARFRLAVKPFAGKEGAQQFNDLDFSMYEGWAEEVEELSPGDGGEGIPAGFWLATLGVLGFCGVGRFWAWRAGA
jgi:hypothetical protein